MKKICIIILILLTVHQLYAPVITYKISENLYTTLFSIIEIESNWDSKAINYKENAFGIIQIRRDVIKDINYYYGTNYRHADAFDINKSLEIFWLYQKMWNPKMTKENISRIWNGGPKGMKKKSSIKYWNKVKNNIKKYE